MALRPRKAATRPIELEPKTAREEEQDAIYFGVIKDTKPAANPGSNSGKGARSAPIQGSKQGGGASISGGTA